MPSDDEPDQRGAAKADNRKHDEYMPPAENIKGDRDRARGEHSSDPAHQRLNAVDKRKLIRRQP